MVSPIIFAVGNIQLKQATKAAGPLDMVSLVAWLSLVPPLPALALSLYFDGASAFPAAIRQSSWLAIAGVFYLAIISGTLAYAIWGRLLHKYSAAQVTSFGLLVPFIAALASALTLGERFGAVRVMGMALVLAGLAIIVLPRERVQSMLGRLAAAVGKR